MLTVTLTALALVAACIIVWFAARRTRVVQRVSTRLSGPVEQMQEQIMLTADTAVDHLDGKIAQMEILLSEIDRRSALLAQQSKQQQLQQLQLEQQQQQMVIWFQTQRQQAEKEFALKHQELMNVQAQQKMSAQQSSFAEKNSMETEPVRISGNERNAETVETDTKPISSRSTKIEKISREPKNEAPPPPRNDKRATILDMAEQGCSVTEIAQKMGVGKGEVMLLLKLRKKAAT
ncbi:MAG: hypothetical protein AB9917_03580 [Negativicutes bacterium]